MTEITAERMDELEAIARTATPGAWRREAMGGSSSVMCQTKPRRNDTRIPTYGYREGGEHCIAYPFIPDENLADVRLDFVSMSHGDAAHIAAFDPPTVLALIALTRRSVAAPDRMQIAKMVRELVDQEADADAHTRLVKAHNLLASDAPDEADREWAKQAAREVAGAVAGTEGMESPDLFWNAEDPETGGQSEYDIVGDYGPGEVVRIQCAKSLPDFYGVWWLPKDQDDAEYAFGTAEECAAALFLQEGR